MTNKSIRLDDPHISEFRIETPSPSCEEVMVLRSDGSVTVNEELGADEVARRVLELIARIGPDWIHPPEDVE